MYKRMDAYVYVFMCIGYCEHFPDICQRKDAIIKMNE